MRWLALVFVVLPIVDLWLLLRLGDHLGFWPTLGLAVGSGFLGAWLAKREGGRVIRSWLRSFQTFQPPERGVIDGVLVIAGAALLAAPGLLTDVLGFALLVPWTRRPFAWLVRRKVDRYLAEGALRVQRAHFGAVDLGDLARGFSVRPGGVGATGVIDTEGSEATDRTDAAPRSPRTGDSAASEGVRPSDAPDPGADKLLR